MDELKLIPVAVVRTIRLGGKALIPVELSHAVGGQELVFRLDHRNRQVADLTRFKGDARHELLTALRAHPKSWTLLGADGEPFVETPTPDSAPGSPALPVELPVETPSVPPVDTPTPDSAPESPFVSIASEAETSRRGRGRGRRV